MHPLAQELATNTRLSLHFVTKSIEAYPADRWEWSIGGKARSAREVVQEMVVFPAWIEACLECGGIAGFPDMSALPTDRETLVARLREVTEGLLARIESTPEAEWQKPNPMPWDPSATAGRVLGYHEWNNTYHLGQLNLIQLAYGDEEFHM